MYQVPLQVFDEHPLPEPVKFFMLFSKRLLTIYCCVMDLV
jgi:hypothetical protein